MEDENVDGKVRNVEAIVEKEKLDENAATTKIDELTRDSSIAATREKGTIKLKNNVDKCGSKKIPETGSKTAKIVATLGKKSTKISKREILAGNRENRGVVSRSLQREKRRGVGIVGAGGKKTKRGTGEAKRGKITEYAQYLGLQPASSNKADCTNCRETKNSHCSTSMLDQHQCTCTGEIMTQSTLGNVSPISTETSVGPLTSANTGGTNNFRITRKVYLCAACGTYFENWNLFLHMREIHKRHICLFCLGMFGQAERLSYHLMKKHSVPETTFTSVEDFYNVFKGSCYLICCTCEKVFAETDNFYNHFCSPVVKGRGAAAQTNEICSLCRKSVNNHASTCLHGQPENRDSAIAGLPGIPGIAGKNVGTKRIPRNKRITKNNRLKRNAESSLTTECDKKTGTYARKLSVKAREQLDETPIDNVENNTIVESLETATTTAPTTISTISTTSTNLPITSSTKVSTENDSTNILRDTVSETIMEVSKYTDDPRFHHGFHEPSVDFIERTIKITSSPSPSLSSSSLTSPMRQIGESCYDSVTETIMEVSRRYNDNEIDSSVEDNNDDDEDNVNDDKSDVLIMDDPGLTENDEETTTSNRRIAYDDRLKNSLSIVAKNDRRRKKRRKTRRKDEETIEQSDSNNGRTSTDTENDATNNDESTSRTSRSWQNTISDRRSSSSSPAKESHARSSVSFTTVNSTDRSLVIKICTNRNSQFSITRSINGAPASNAICNNDNHDTSRESEENNNAEDSASEGKMSIHSDHADRESCDDNDNDDDGEEEMHSDAEKFNSKTVESEITNINVEVTDATRQENSAKDDEYTRNEITADDTEKLANDDKNDECPLNVETLIDTEKSTNEENDGIVLAAEDVPSIDLNVDGILESMKIDELLKRCINAAAIYCVYCNHARCIAVNGKQLGLHVLAEHRFQPQHSAIIIQREQFIDILKKSLDDVETSFFNLDSYDNARGTYDVPVPRVFECFHCRYHSHVHKEIYLHNRKMHQKTILICIMCKSTFYSYSELLCHLCPGVYSPNTNVTYRCCLCPVDNFPSAFRLMVHLRKRHHSCDVCLESTGNQQRLSNHVWKHKLHHLCYRCGIAYRNKPDITKHLFWKHGTESVLCKKCLQKKWPHVYHFCIPPTAFVCEECTSSFTRAVALKVHKRLHTGDRPYGCSECDERFISKKLMIKHELGHREPAFVEPEVKEVPSMDSSTKEEGQIGQEKIDVVTIAETTTTTTTTLTTTSDAEITNAGDHCEKSAESTIENKEAKEPVKKVVDVYDLPPLNLSSDSDTDNEEIPPTAETTSKDPTEVKSTLEESTKVDNDETTEEDKAMKTETSDVIVDNVELNEDVKKEEAQIMDGIWDNFKSYAASLPNPPIEMTIAEARRNEEEARIREKEAIEKKRRDDEMREFLCKIIIADHDYCVVYPDKSVDEEEETREDTKEETTKIDDNCGTMEGEHDYGHKNAESPSNGSIVINCDSDNATATTKRKKEKTPKKKKTNGATSSSDSSSDSDSSSCSCGTNCSCSSSSSGSSSSSSSSSDSDSSASESSPRKQTVRKERRREKEKENTSIEAGRNSVEKPEIEEKIEITSIAEENEQKEIVAEEEIKDLNSIEETNAQERPASPQLIFRESDLDTDETETDEDFYDEHPQQLANKLLAEKRNQLMLLAAVAPVITETNVAASNNLNNGNFTNEAINEKPADIALSLNEDTNKFDNTSNLGTTRKRVKTKKRKKSDRVKAPRISTPTVESIKLNIPKSFYQKKNKKNSSTLITVMPSRSSTPSIVNSTPNETTTKYPNDTSKSVRIGESGSENENKRSSKRKRVPKRFYGDSSDEELQQQHQQQQIQYQTPEFHYNQPNLKWRKVETPPVVPSISIKAPIPPPTPPNPSYGTKSVTLKLSGFDRPLERIVPIVTAPSESEEQAESSSADSSENEETPVPVVQPQTPQISRPPIQHHPAMIGNPTMSTVGPERAPNLYCYCQCPYDEVSEMIACDGNDCHIEWFHFECVGIMVPPKGKWYCPDCRKKDPSLVNDEYLE